MALYICPSSSSTTSTSLASERRCPHSSYHGFICYLKMAPSFHEKRSLFLPENRPKSMRLNVLAKSSDEDFLPSPMAPFQPLSEAGLFLSQLLHTNPDLVPSAVEHELERLSGNRNAESCQINGSSGSTSDQDLYRRIAELKSQERFNSLEEILYMLIVRKFIEAGIIMISDIRILESSRVPWTVQVKELESLYAPEALELIREHSLLVLGKRGLSKYFGKSMFAHLSKMSLKEIYASSVTYGYFLRRLHNRCQLEKSIALFHHSGDTQGKVGPGDIAAAMAVLKDLRGSTQTPNFTQVMTSEFLAYITSFDAETLRGFTVVRSKESQSVLEKHTRALFQGMKPQKSADEKSASQVSFVKSKGLVLEAVAFGSFLWDVETYVDGFYSLIEH